MSKAEVLNRHHRNLQEDSGDYEWLSMDQILGELKSHGIELETFQIQQRLSQIYQSQDIRVGIEIGEDVDDDRYSRTLVNKFIVSHTGKPVARPSLPPRPTQLPDSPRPTHLPMTDTAVIPYKTRLESVNILPANIERKETKLTFQEQQLLKLDSTKKVIQAVMKTPQQGLVSLGLLRNVESVTSFLVKRGFRMNDVNHILEVQQSTSLIHIIHFLKDVTEYSALFSDEEPKDFKLFQFIWLVKQNNLGNIPFISGYEFLRRIGVGNNLPLVFLKDLQSEKQEEIVVDLTGKDVAFFRNSSPSIILTEIRKNKALDYTVIEVSELTRKEIARLRD